MRRDASLLLVLPAAVVAAGSGIATRFLRGARQVCQTGQAELCEQSSATTCTCPYNYCCLPGCCLLQLPLLALPCCLAAPPLPCCSLLT
jgi:hypothetical protein